MAAVTDQATDQNQWTALREANPGHSQWYIERFRNLAESGVDLAGEARLVDAMLPRGSRVLDAGCGTGRVGGWLAAAGHDVVGVDFDAELIEAAGRDHPAARWLVDDLSTMDLPACGIADGFDVVVCAGNVMTFLAPGTRRDVLRRMRDHVRGDGRVVVGFGAGRGYGFDDFFADASISGLAPDVLLSTWDLRPLMPGSDFLVALLRRTNIEPPVTPR